jgi:hypothetical protein
MTYKTGSTIIVEPERPACCELCGEIAELRPYGPGGKKICVECGNKDPAGTHERMISAMETLLTGTTHVISPYSSKVLRVGHLMEDLLAPEKPKDQN